MGQKKRAILQEVSAPAAPLVGVALLIAFLAIAGLTTLKAWDATQPRATVIVSKVSVQSAPGENQATLFDLSEGLEVLVRQKSETWLQISYPGGLSGWVPEKSLMQNQL